MNSFGDLFEYDCCTDLIGGRRFYNCVMKKDAYNKTKGERLGIVVIEPRHISFGYDDPTGYFLTRFPFLMREPSLRVIQDEVHKRLLKNIHIVMFTMWTDIEDSYGVCLSVRTGMFIDQYATCLKYEFEKSVKIIQHHWKRVISNPNYAMCKRRLKREFENELKNDDVLFAQT